VSGSVSETVSELYEANKKAPFSQRETGLNERK
jgi:hypothetical protein